MINHYDLIKLCYLKERCVFIQIHLNRTRSTLRFHSFLFLFNNRNDFRINRSIHFIILNFFELFLNIFKFFQKLF